MLDKKSEESWTNPEEDRGWSRESHEQYMYRRNHEEDLLKGTYKYEYDNATNVVKYITRHKTKGQEEDIRKVIHYCELILQHKYAKWK
jgi:hypothetical protein